MFYLNFAHTEHTDTHALDVTNNDSLRLSVEVPTSGSRGAGMRSATWVCGVCSTRTKHADAPDKVKTTFRDQIDSVPVEKLTPCQTYLGTDTHNHLHKVATKKYRPDTREQDASSSTRKWN